MRSYKELKGSELPQSKLDEDDVRIIREARVEYEKLMDQARSLSAQSLAEKFGVSRNTIHRVWNYSDWKHV